MSKLGAAESARTRRGGSVASRDGRGRKAVSPRRLGEAEGVNEGTVDEAR